MSERIARARMALFGAAVAGALAVGGSAVAAEPRKVECSNPAAACLTQVECIRFCFPRGGRCNATLGAEGCCACNR